MKGAMHGKKDSNKKHLIGETRKSEFGWQAWQVRYSLKRNRVFLRIVDALKKHLPIS